MYATLLAQAASDTAVAADPAGDASLQETLADAVGGGLVGEAIAYGLQILLILVVAWIANLLARRVIRGMVVEAKDDDSHTRLGRLKEKARLKFREGETTPSLRRAQRADALGALARSIVSTVIWGLAIVTILNLFIPIGPIVASAGIVGVAVGFGAQDLVKDFLSGIFMLVEDQYGVGDIIDAGEASGVVEGVGLRSTRVRDVSGTLWHIPNGEIRRVGNMSQEWARTLLDISVAYDTDIDDASALILDVATGMAHEDAYAGSFLAEPEVWGVENFGADAIDIRLVIKTHPGDQWAIGRELRARLKKAFDAAGIEIPFPQRTVWLRSEDAPPAAELGGATAE